MEVIAKPRERLAQPEITLLERRAKLHPTAEGLAGENGGRLLTLREFLRALKDPRQYEMFKGDWYWLGDEPGLKANGRCRVDYEEGRLVPVASKAEWDALPPEEKAYAQKGIGHLAVFVLRPDSDSGMRLVLFAGNYPGAEDSKVKARVAIVKSELVAERRE